MKLSSILTAQSFAFASALIFMGQVRFMLSLSGVMPRRAKAVRLLVNHQWDKAVPHQYSPVIPTWVRRGVPTP